MATRLPEALPATSGGGGGITGSYEYGNNSLNDEFSSAAIILYPRSATVFAAICASIFTVVGIGGKKTHKYIIYLILHLHASNHLLNLSNVIRRVCVKKSVVTSN